MMKIPEPPSAARSFSKLGVIVLIAGCALAFGLSRNRIDPDLARYARMAILATVIGAGICFIAASAKSWMKR
jgi:hypothetical protein